MVEEILSRDIDEVKAHVEENVHELDLAELVEFEEENQGRQELVLWLLRKQKRRKLLKDEELVEALLAHTEEAYRTAAISQGTYDTVKQVNRELLENN